MQHLGVPLARRLFQSATPCRCHLGNFMDLITPEERRAVEAWLCTCLRTLRFLHARCVWDPAEPGIIGFIKECAMRFILIFYVVVVCTLSTHAAAPTKAPRAAPVSINIRAAGDLADACTVSPNSKSSFARLNFCNGFAQGTLQTNSQNSSGAKICIPTLLQNAAKL
jgi:hypothetical protein